MAAIHTETKIFTGIGLDFETGSLDCTTGAVTQIAMQAVCLDTLETTDRYVEYIAPYAKKDAGGPARRKVLRPRHEINREKEAEMMDYQPEALAYSGITMDMLLASGADMAGVANCVIDFAKRNTPSRGRQAKPVLIGQNITFDIGFLQQLMNYAGLVKEFEKVFAGSKDFYGNFQPHYIDSIHLARLALAGDPSVNSYKLEMISERLGIELDDAHDADADITATLNILRVCSGRLRNQSPDTGMAIEKKEKTRAHFKI